jgi:aryl-alcohol dehydrogenase-like predicted oxidoreductase
MNKQPLGRTGLNVSELAFGTDLIGSKIDQATSFSLLDFYVERGGNFIDTANIYASWLPGCKGGESETTIGSWVKQRRNRESLILSSKLGFDYPDSRGGLTSREIERECEKSLKRLQTDRIDLYYAHRDDVSTPLEETMEAFWRLSSSGKIRAIGASNLPVWRIAEADVVSELNEWSTYQVIQQRYTYLRPRHGADFGPQLFISSEAKQFAAAHQIALVGYSILLRGAYTRADRPVPDQFVGTDSNERISQLQSIAKEVGKTANQVIIAWMRQSQPAVLPIIAGSHQEQLAENIDALALTLTDDQFQKLDTAGNPDVKRAWLQPT